MSLTLNGERTQGEDVRSQNVTACMAVANIVKSSLGPVGLDKMLVDEIGDVTITNDGATILKLLNVEHPAAKVLVELSDLQDKEVGDGTTSVVILAAELMARANVLYKQKIHPTSIISGYKLAMKECVKYIKENLLIPAEQINDDVLKSCAKTAMSSKIIGAESDFFGKMVVDCVKKLKRVDDFGKTVYPIDNAFILKCHGKSAIESELVNGFALDVTRASMQMPQSVVNAKIALLDFDLQRHRMQMGVEVLLNNPDQLESIQQREEDITKERIQKILSAGTNVIFTTKGIDDMSMKYFVEAKCIAVRRLTREKMEMIAKATGATILSTLSDLEGNEKFDSANLGSAEEVCEQRVGDGEFLYIKGCKTTEAVTIVLRGANEYMLNEMERSLHDSLCVIKRVLESKSLIVGGGAVDAALSMYLDRFATSLGSREQLAIQQFSEALLVIPKTLAVNAGKDASELIAKLCAKHNLCQSRKAKSGSNSKDNSSSSSSNGSNNNNNNENDDLKYSGLDLIEGKIVNNFKAGVLEPAISKVKSIRFATEAAITILRIDDMIKINPKEEHQAGNTTPPIH